jgi:hypothetical protein
MRPHDDELQSFSKGHTPRFSEKREEVMDP